MRRGPAILLLLILLMSGSYGAQWVGNAAWDLTINRTPPHAEVLRPANGTVPLSGKVILVLADGLRFDDAPFLPSVEWLMREGAYYRVTVPEPAYAMPATATLFTGANPISHNLLLPRLTTEIVSDSLLAAAQRTRLATAGVGSAALPGPLLASTLDEWSSPGTEGQFQEIAEALVRPGGARLVVLQLTDLLQRAQANGTANRRDDAHKETLADWDAKFGRILEQVDLKTSTIVLLGFTPLNGRGDFDDRQPLPLVMAGAGVRPGVLGAANLVDIAPTLAVLTGLPTPVANEGRPLMDALAVQGGAQDQIAQRYLAIRQTLAGSYLKAMDSSATLPEPPASWEAAAAYEQALDSLMHETWLEQVKQGFIDRAPYFGGALLLVLIYLVVVARQPFGGPVYAGAFTYIVVFHALLYLTGGRYASSLVGLDQLDVWFMTKIVGRMAGAMLVSSLITGWFLSRRGFKKGPYLATASLQMALSTAVLVALPGAIAKWGLGWSIPATLPPLPYLVWFFLTVIQVMVIGYLSPIWALFATWFARFSLRKWPLKEIGDPVVNADKVVRLKVLNRTQRNSVQKR